MSTNGPGSRKHFNFLNAKQRVAVTLWLVKLGHDAAMEATLEDLAKEATNLLGFTVTPPNMSTLRAGVYGIAQKAQRVDPSARIAALEQRVANLERAIRPELGLKVHNG